MRLGLLALVMVGCTGPAVVSAGSAELAIPQTLEFGRTALSFSRTRPLVVVNRARVAKTVEVSVSGPFSAPATLEVPGGAEVSLEVTFSPGSVGVVAGVLLLDGVEVALTGDGVAALECGASTVCDVVAFDPETLSCVHTPKPDGSACEDELACIEGGTCQAGACLGRAARCDDGNACTSDACSVGRGCQHEARQCAQPSNPCQAPVCDPLLGCGAAPVQDGTPCGAVSCELANVCLAGQCRAVVPPEGFTCSPESACRGEGVCRNKTCVRPPERELSPRWTYTANTGDFRFEGVTDAQGNWYWVECTTMAVRMGTGPAPVPPKQPSHQCDVHSRTPDGLERFRAEVTGTGVLRGMTEKTQLIAQGLFIFAVNEATLAAVNISTGVLVWQQAISAGPTRGYHAVEALAEDGRGGLWAITREDAESSSWALARLDVASGRVLVRKGRPSRIRGLVVDAAGRAYVLGDGPPSSLPVNPVRAVIERVELDGTIGFSVSADPQPPVMVLGDRLVMADDSVRSTVDGRELEPSSSTEWTTTEWAGVSSGTASSRLRLARFIGAPPPLPPSLPLPRIALQTSDPRGTRTRSFSTTADRSTEAFLTAAGEALFVTTADSVTPTRETRAHQVHPLGLELMSCALVDAEAPGSTTTAALRFGSKVGFNGRFFAVQSLMTDCEGCDRDLWSPPRIAFYDFGRPGPGVARTGWTGPRGTPGNGSRAR
ncbi:MAG: hypothetical protein Q8S33_11575 [Myxococcales bacterium]|nr:hypothetical protein [Myxococcales bacterium]